MTETVRPIQPSTFGARAWKPFADYRFALGNTVVALSTEEFAHTIAAFPIAFTVGDTPTPVAVLGLRPGSNLFVAPNGQWLGPYIPAALRGYPFRLMRIDDDQFALGYDEASGLLVAEGQGEPFFGPDGQPAEKVDATLKFLMNVNRGQQAAAALAAKLAAAGVLEPWPLQIKDKEQVTSVNGLLRVSEQALNALADDAFLELRRAGALALAYAQLLSTANIAALGRLAQLHAKHAEDLDRQATATNHLLGSSEANSQDTIDIDALLPGGN